MNDVQLCGGLPVAAGGAVVDRTKRTELAKAARREEILAAARRVFAREGFGGTTIADIAREASIALGTVYLYFSSKEDVFAALSDQLSDLITDALTSVPAASTLDETVRRRIGNVFDVCAGNRDLVRLVVLNIDQRSEVTKRLKKADAARGAPILQAIAEAMQAGLVRVADPVIMTNLTRGAVSFAVYQAFVLSDGKDADKYRDACSDMIVAYMTPQV
jgi:AcrR family transcriptional regulator